MADASFLARLQAARQRWVRLDAEREVCVRRPAEARLPKLLLHGTAEDYAACVVDWRGPGFTEQGLLGRALGGDAPVPFAPEVWLDVALDHVTWLNAVAEAVREDASSFLQQREAAAKN